ncbi:MAG: hypothetical protein Kow0088_03470 [Anaerolineales bacterium]
MATLLAFLVFIPLLMLQIGVISSLPLIQGYPDLILLAILAWSLKPGVRTAWQWGLLGGLLMTVVSALPVGVYFAAYLLSVAMASIVRKIVWRIPFLMMLVMTILCTLLTNVLSYAFLQLIGRDLSFEFAFRAIIVPSVLYNLLLALPIYALIGELSRWVYPPEPIYES